MPTPPQPQRRFSTVATSTSPTVTPAIAPLRPGTIHRMPGRFRIAMSVVPEPRPGTPGVIVMARPNTPTFSGRSSTDYVCGNCSFPIAAGVEPGSIGGKLVLKCSACGAFNRAGAPAR